MTPEERKEATRRKSLDQANAIRTRRSELKRELATGSVKLGEVLAGDDELLRSMPIRQLIAAVPGFGPKRVPRILSALRFTNSTRLENVNPQRRQELLAWIRTNCPRYEGRI